MRRVAALSAIALLVGAGVLVERELRGLCRTAADILNGGTQCGLWHCTMEDKAAADAALDRLVAERDEAIQRERNAAEWLEIALARAEAAEKERDEAQEALQNLAADHYFARAEAAEARISILERQVQNLGALATERQARCATLEAALRELTIAVTHFLEFEVDWDVEVGWWSSESTAAWNRIEEILDANLAAARAALAAATPPTEEEGTA